MLTAEDLLLQVREQSDEYNTDDISDTLILRALSRGQQKLTSMASAKSSSIFITECILSPEDFTGNVATIPPIFPAYKVLAVEAHYSNRSAIKLQARAFSALTPWKVGNSWGGVPAVYSIAGNKLTVSPGINSISHISVILQVRPLPLVKSLGRVSNIDDIATNVFSIVEWNDGLTTEIDDLNCFLNIVDPLTGIVKGTVQINSLDEDATSIEISSSPLRSKVFGLTVSSSLEDIDIALDDEICLAKGTCVPYLMEDFSNYLISFATLEIKRSLGENVEAEYANLKEMEEEVKRSWAGTPGIMRVKHTNKNWRKLSLRHLFSR